MRASLKRLSSWFAAGVLLGSQIFCANKAAAAELAEPGAIAALIAKAEGTYSAAQLPVICVSIHPNSATPERNLALLQRAGATCARTDTVWHLIEKPGSAGSYDWSSYDDLWQPLCKAGIKPVMIATYNNPVYAAGVFRPIEGGVNIAAFANFTVAMANHYISICPTMAIELFNEPSAQNWTTVPWSGASYAAMLAPVSAAIKAAQPHVEVYSGGIGFDPGPHAADWIKDMAGAGFKFPAVDRYAFHPYNYDQNAPSKTLPPEQLLIDTARFAEASGSSGQTRPVVITEYGFPLEALSGDAMKQARYVARGMLASIIGGYRLYTYYDLIDDGAVGANIENTFGLFRNGSDKHPYEMKPAGTAFTAITGAMAKAKNFTISFDATFAAPMLAFHKAEGKTFVIWTYDENTTKAYSRTIGPFRKISCKDVLGKAYPCSYASSVLSMTLSDSSGPIVVTALK